MKIFTLIESINLYENFQLALRDFSADNDITTVKSALDRFRKLQSRISDPQEKDINHWRKQGFDKMLSFMDEVESRESKRQRIKKVKAASSDILTIKKEGDVHLFVPLSKEASCFYGSGTPWCISTRDGNNYFYSYTISKGMYVVFLIKGVDVYALVMNEHGDITEVQDKRNENDIPAEDFFKMAGIGRREVYLFLKTNRDTIMSGTVENAGKVIIDKLLSLISDVEENEPEIHSILVDETGLMRKLRRVGGEKYKKIEAAIAKHPMLAYVYAANVVNGWWPEGEEAILKSASYSYRYALSVLGGRWPEAEGIIMTHATPAAMYSARILQRRWHEAEPIIAKNASAAYTYAVNVINGRWPEGEEAIMKAGPEVAYKYAQVVLRDQWPEAEEMILADPTFGPKYRRDFL